LSSVPPHPEAARGAIAATVCFVVWGLIAAYWKLLAHVGALELISHRALWSLGLLVGLLAWQGRLGPVQAALRDRRTLAYNATTGTLLMVNWLAFIWAVNHDHVLESSLGYFLVPLCNVASGYVFLHERLRPVQWVAIGLAAAGVLALLLGVGRLPWVALVIALTWTGYGLVRKKSPMGAVDGLTVETLLLTPLLGGYLLWLAFQGKGALGHASARDHVLLVSGGLITAVPLVLFAYGARRIRLATLGLLQYIAPSLQFLLGWLVYREPLDAARLQAYALIWAGLVLYSADSFWSQRRALFA